MRSLQWYNKIDFQPLRSCEALIILKKFWFQDCIASCISGWLQFRNELPNYYLFDNNNIQMMMMINSNSLFLQDTYQAKCFHYLISFSDLLSLNILIIIAML